MNGIECVLDTNVVVDFLDGDETVAAFWRGQVQGRKVAVSQITRMELLSAPGITPDAEGEIRGLLHALRVVGISVSVEENTVSLRRDHALKLPDAIIAATAETLKCPLVTADAELARKLASRLEVTNPRAPATAANAEEAESRGTRLRED